MPQGVSIVCHDQHDRAAGSPGNDATKANSPLPQHESQYTPVRNGAAPDHDRHTGPIIAAFDGDTNVSPRCDHRHAPIHQSLNLVRNKWVVGVLGTLADTTTELRFSELQRSLRGISRKMLWSTLRGVARDGLIRRRVESLVPPQVYYRISDLGRSLVVTLDVLRRWGEANMTAVDRARRSFDAGTSHDIYDDLV